MGDRTERRTGAGISGSMQGVGGLLSMSRDAVKFLFQRPFQAKEFIEQSWFV
ncbi:ABC transporter permease, partial [Mycobacterium sp. ITM-2017-0098]